MINLNLITFMKRYNNHTVNKKIELSLFILSILLNIFFIILVFSNLSAYHFSMYFNSDTLYMPSIYKDVFIDGTGFKGWHLNGAPNFFPDMLFYCIINWITGNFISACFTYSIIQYVFILFMFYLIYIEFFGKNNLAPITIANLLMTLFFLTNLRNNDFMFSFLTLSISYHMGAFVMSLIAMFFTFKYYNSSKTRYLILLFVFSTLGFINDRLFVVMYSLPVFSFIALIFIRTGRKRILFILSSNVLSMLIGYLLFRAIKFSNYIYIYGLEGKIYNFANMKKCISIMLSEHWNILLEMKNHGIIFILTILSFFLMVYIAIKNIRGIYLKKSIDNKILINTLFVLFASSFIFITYLNPAINGYYLGLAHLRYNIYVLYLGIFSISFLINIVLANYGKIQNVINYTLALFFLMVAINHASKIKIGNGLKEFFNYYPNSVQQIDNVAKENGLKYGISEYWTAKLTTMFSKEDLRVYTVFEKLVPWYHVTNENWYYNTGKGKYGNPEFDFIITNGLDTSFIKDRLGEPLDIIKSEDGHKIYITNPYSFESKTRKIKVIK